ncbi:MULTISPECIES: hypothetical protein [unclassified Chitinophaga]|uniref:hypothetical protein n=1 Tax=unclassified Chitinophaga TaxID=2619133 RepID=UPI0009CA57F9|nr:MULTISPECIES: hypothetical protein [unclassified Chitinophaga]OMP74878.1 hypothetical protein BW716_33135 [[Flexibacter] sp. ATCC 35208]WPV69669.1 hypothetical protein QQL36_13275 [Chitinophaga sp. LS1]
MKKVLIIIVGIVLFVWVLRSDCHRKNQTNKLALENLDLQLTGIVENVENGDNFHGYGIVRLRIVSSNIQTYDPRGKLQYYFCVIKDGVAEVYDHASTSNTFVGDTLVYNTKEKKGAIIKNGKKTQEGSIGVSTEDAYYRYIERKTIFK